MNYKHLHISTRRGNYLLITLPTILINLIPNSGVKIRDYCYSIVINIIIICSCLTSDAVPIKVHADYCRDIDTKNLQGEREW